MRLGSRPRLVVLAVATVMAAGACTSGGSGGTSSSTAPTDAPSTTTAAVTSSAPPTTAAGDPNVPAAARAATMDGATEFVKYFAQQLNTAYRTADPGPIAALSKASCPACQTLVQEVQSLQAAGNHVDGDLWAVRDTVINSFASDAPAVVIAKIHQNPVATVDKTGAQVLRWKDETSELAFTLSHEGAGWMVSRLQVVQ